MDEPTKTAEPEPSRTVANLVLLSVFAVIVGIGVWLVLALDHARKIDDCVSQGRRNCSQIDSSGR